LLKNAAKPPRGLIFLRAAECGGAKTKIRSSCIQNTPQITPPERVLAGLLLFKLQV